MNKNFVTGTAIGLAAMFILKKTGSIGGFFNTGRTTVRAIIEDGDKLLLVQRAQHDTAGGKWQFVGGTVGKERIDAALVREVKEEINLNAYHLEFFTRVYNEKTETNTIYYRCQVTGKIKLQDSELQNHIWVTLAEAYAMRDRLTPSTLAILKHISKENERALQVSDYEFDFGL